MKKPAKEIHEISEILQQYEKSLSDLKILGVYIAKFNKVINYIDYLTTQLSKK